MPEQPYARIGLAIVRLTIGAMFVWVFFENLGKGLYTPNGYAGLDQLLHPTRSRSGHLESGDGDCGESCSDGGAASGRDGDFARGALILGLLTRPAGTCRIWFAREPVGVGVGHVVDLGAAGSVAGGAGDRGGSGRAGHGGLMRFWRGGDRRFGGRQTERWSRELLREIVASLGHYSHAQRGGAPSVRCSRDVPADLVTEVIVVDSNSTDGTPEIAERAGARVIFEHRRGYGQACLTGLANANSPDVVVFLDGDYSDRPAELAALARADLRRTRGHYAGLATWQGRAFPVRFPGTQRLETASLRS